MYDEIEARRWGIIPSFHKVAGKPVKAPAKTVTHILEQMKSSSLGPHSPGPIIIVPGERPAVKAPARVVTEQGETLSVRDRLPARLPYGYHLLEEKGRTTQLIVCPSTCYRPTGMDEWGWAVQVPSLRSERSWGVGDFEDLRTLSKRLVRGGAGAVTVNPLAAPLPVVPQQTSPYYPSSRAFIDPIYLSVDRLPEKPDLGDLDAAGYRLSRRRRLDRDAVYLLKMRAAERAFESFRGARALDAYRDSWGGALESYARFCARTETHRWEDSRRVLFHMWMQMRLDQQLTRAAEVAPLIFDLPVGVDPKGAEAWDLDQMVVHGVSIGAPPDAFNAAGQVWGLTAYSPWALRASGYRTFIRLIRRWMTAGAGIRIDHILGLFRQFWVPEGEGADRGVYVRFPWRDLFRLLALESHRNQAFVIGEDLGTVESRVRREMAVHKIFGQRLMLFETGRKAAYGRWAMATVTNHDLPTIAGLWTGKDALVQRREGMMPPEDELEKAKKRMAAIGDVDLDCSPHEASVALHSALARSKYALRVATMEDALGVTERVNLPGTLRADNWRLALPVRVERIGGTRSFRDVESMMRGD